MKPLTLTTFLLAMTFMLSSHQETGNPDDKGEIIALPVAEKKIDASISEHFSRSPFFCLYNTNTGSGLSLKTHKVLLHKVAAAE